MPLDASLRRRHIQSLRNQKKSPHRRRAAFEQLEQRALLATWANNLLDADANWTTPSNWVDGVVPALGEIAIFPASATIELPVIPSNVSIAGVQIDNSGADYAFSGAGTLSIGTSGISVSSPTSATANTTTISAPLALAANQAWTLTNSGAATTALTVSAAISGSSTLTKAGDGTLALSGANTYTGATTVNGGTLRAGASTTVFGNNSAVTLANTVGVTLDLNNFNVSIGSLAGVGTTGGSVNLGTGTLTTGGNNTSTDFGGTFTGAGGAGLIKQGSGTQTLSRVGLALTNIATSINAGTVTYTGGSLSGGSITINNNGTLFFNPGVNRQGQATAGNVISNNLVIGGATTNLRFAANDAKWNMTGAISVTSASNAILNIFSGNGGGGLGDRNNILFSTPIPNGGGGVTLGLNVTFTGQAGAAAHASMVNLSAANTFTGPITVTGNASAAPGYLVIGGESYYPNGGPKTNIVGSGTLGGGNYTNTISLTTPTAILNYLSTANQTLGGTIPALVRSSRKAPAPKPSAAPTPIPVAPPSAAAHWLFKTLMPQRRTALRRARCWS